MSRNVAFYLDLPRTEASCSASIQLIQEVDWKYFITPQNRYRQLLILNPHCVRRKKKCDGLDLFEVVSYLIVVPHLFVAIWYLCAVNRCLYIILLKKSLLGPVPDK